MRGVILVSLQKSAQEDRDDALLFPLSLQPGFSHMFRIPDTASCRRFVHNALTYTPDFMTEDLLLVDGNSDRCLRCSRRLVWIGLSV